MAAKRASESAPAAAYAVFGPEAFLKRNALTDIGSRVLGEADRSLCFSEYEGASNELAPILDDLRTLPFLADRRLVLVREADTFITRHRDAIEEYLGAPSPTGVLVLECKSLPKNTRLYKKIDALGGIVACEAVPARAIAGWIGKRSQEAHGVRIDAGAAALLADLVGNDLGLLDGELQKLSIYVGERQRIAVADVEALVGQQREEEIWGILSAMAAGDQSKAMSLWEGVYQTDRAAEARAVAGMAYKVRQMLNARKAHEAGASMNDVGRMLMIWGNPQRVQAELNAFTTRQLEDMLCKLLEADLAAKSGGVSVQTSIETLIVESCQDRPGRRARA
ncbi:MAG: hypothetical protein AMXMBFR13_40740 [Phycisphaerae bacterium]